MRQALQLAILLAVAVASSAGTWPAPQLRGPSEVVEIAGVALGSSQARDQEAWVSRVFDVLAEEGWPWARVRPDTTAGRENWYVEIEPGPRMKIRSLDLRGPDEQLLEVWREHIALEVGDALRPGRWQGQVKAALRELGERGHAFASVTVLRQAANPMTGEVELTLLIRPGPKPSVRKIEVEGATRTRPDVLARLSGLREGQAVSEETLERATDRLLARPGIVDAVEPVQVVSVLDSDDEVDLRLRVHQSPARGSFGAAVGLVRNGDADSRLSGQVDLEIFDLFGTARSFSGHWSDDGRSRRSLDLDYVEPAAFSTSLDLGLSLGQRHEDASYDLVRGDLEVRLPGSVRRQLEFRIGADRTTFEGGVGRLRWRQRVGVELGLRWSRGVTAGLFGSLRSAVQGARVRDVQKAVAGTERVAASTTQTLIEIDTLGGWAFSRVVALQVDLGWRSTETDALPLPRSERWALGGAATVRGHVEQRFLGERVGFARSELVLGPESSGQGYAFFDIGWVQATTDLGQGPRREEDWLNGFGLGVSSPTALGQVDLSLGFARSVGLDSGKLHLVLQRSF